jgi:hypothetical protein
MITVYHGSTVSIEKPDTFHSKNFLDFGKGFYVTMYKEQAGKWANRKALRLGGSPIVSVLEYDDKVENLLILDFQKTNEAWLDFVCNCRKGNITDVTYDIIKGRVANDDVFKTIDLYLKGIWDKGRALDSLVYSRENNQLCFATQKGIDAALHYINSFTV